ncbi:rRNA-processing protein UTP23 like [Quillaja saponaria]|uniref:rRNA-processing protein UTP23 like n=1 Tax=Quillaja saponaria TaxID=32244 RepID=A0AAD7LAX1_QUISA|nr:rRNA-processing protein UTP23 like [Quillaja saponaria]
MRVKKQKRHRRTVTFYSACFGFRKPYKVLCDGTFIHHVLVNRITPADKALTNLLGATVKLFTTSCVLAELKRLGAAYSEALEAAHKIITARCDHEKSKSADACIMDVIGENNSEHFFVATQDTDLRKKFQEIPGVPLVFGLRNALLLESPSAFQRQFAQNLDKKRSQMPGLEYKTLKKKVKRSTKDDEAVHSSDEIMVVGDKFLDMQDLTQMHTAKNQMDGRDKVQFKRKKAKGPNPLSCKKKKHRENQNSVPFKEIKDGDSTSKRSRKRKRSHRRQTPAEANS